jgi:uncharacterized membrane protein HdeD (DUF308 family)
MTLDRIFFAYIAVIGIALGAALVAAPRLQDFVIKPYFWILIAVALFDVGAYLRGKNAPGTMLSMQARLLGFVIGIVLMVAVPTLGGAQVRFF